MNYQPIKIIFLGTPEFAVPYLRSLLTNNDFKVLAVITQPDKPSGRKQELLPPPIKILAKEFYLPTFQPGKLKENTEIINEIKNLQPDLLVVVAYGQIIPQEILDIASSGNINVHPSLLPKYRGASPIQSALLNDEKKTGLTIMLMDAKMDHGPILAQQEVSLTGEETNESLHRDLAEIGVPLLRETIKKYLAGEIKPREQDHEAATFCKTITKDDAKINWQEPAQKIKNKIYAFYPWPATWTTLAGQRLKIFPPVTIASGNGQPGTITVSNNEFKVTCGKDTLILKKVQLAGKKEMAATDFLRGYQDLSSSILE